MARVDAIIFVAKGSEEGEIIVVTDILRRAGLEALLVSTEKDLSVICARGVEIKCNLILPDPGDSSSDLKNLEVLSSARALVIPGGMNGVISMMGNMRLQQVVKEFHSRKKVIGAIASGPIVLKKFGLDNIPMTCNETMKDGLEQYTDKDVAISENVISTRGLGTAVPFALTLLKELGGQAHAVAVDIQYAKY
jgi:protein deglycase